MIMQVAAETLAGSTHLWVSQVTALYLLGFRAQYGSMQPGVVLVAHAAYKIVCISGLLFPQLVISPLYWLAVFFLHFLGIAWNYRSADNHHYLEGYWCAALACAHSLSGDDRDVALAASANGLIALCFVVATGCKLCSTRFRNASFFAYTLLFDGRFASLAFRFGLNSQSLLEHHDCKQSLLELKTPVARARVPEGLRRAALFLTWWTIGVEALVGLLFCLPISALTIPRLVALLLFAITTYVLVPVPTFGMILLIMFSCTVDEGMMRALVLGIAALIPIVTPVSQIFCSAVLMVMGKTHASAGVELAKWPQGTPPVAPADPLMKRNFSS